jgi:hypothetical protein
MRRWAVLFVVGALGALLALGFGLYGATSGQRSRADAFLTARDAWAARPFRRYRMVIEQRWSSIVASPCRQQLDVDGRVVVKVELLSCLEYSYFSPQPVDALLDQLAPRLLGRECDGGDCACGRFSADVEYDAALGYSMTLRWATRASCASPPRPTR